MTHVVLLPDLAALAGICPVCRGIMDDTGCRPGRSVVVAERVHARTGVARALEVYCTGKPVLPLVECPSCSGGLG